MTATIHRLPETATEIHYCSRCRRTQAFVDCGDHLLCPKCRKRLDRIACSIRPLPRRTRAVG